MGTYVPLKPILFIPAIRYSSLLISWMCVVTLNMTMNISLLKALQMYKGVNSNLVWSLTWVYK
jgi:hypothetical protein